jgi:uncharacterized membrane protein (UPF0127 family)
VLTGSPLRAALLALLVVGLLGLPPAGNARAQAGCSDASTPYAVVQTAAAPRLGLELARTEPERELGLMYRLVLPAQSGMLFIYTAPSHESYWMYHTFLPLSIAFIDHDGRIVDIQDMPVLNDPNDVQEASRTVYGPAATYWYALEVNQGWFAQHGVAAGQQLTLCLGGA